MTPPSFRNAEIAALLREVALFLSMEDEPFKPRAYEKAAESVELAEDSCADLFAAGGVKKLATIPGIGKSIAEKIAELLTTGTMRYREELYAKTPVDVGALTMVEGVGPKAVRVLYQELGVTDLASLEAVVKEVHAAGALTALPHRREDPAPFQPRKRPLDQVQVHFLPRDVGVAGDEGLAHALEVDAHLGGHSALFMRHHLAMAAPGQKGRIVLDVDHQIEHLLCAVPDQDEFVNGFHRIAACRRF